MYIEDIISTYALRIKLNPFDSNLIMSFFDQLTKGNGFTEKQSVIAVKILKRYTQQITLLGGSGVNLWLDDPKYKFGIRTLTTVKHISVLKDENKIKVKFPYNDALLAEIKKEKSKFISAEWSMEEKSWIFSLEDQAIAFLASWVNDKDFTSDEVFADYAAQVNAITSDFEKHIPMLSLQGKTAKIINAHPSIPQPTSNDVITSLFEARRAGVTVWDQSVDEALNSSSANEITKKFIKSEILEPLSINLEENSIMELVPLIQNMSPCIITVPGGNELSKTKVALELLREAGFENSEISVLFRLPNDTNQDFNNFIKEEKLNSPLSENTKVVFLSGKVPKPLFESKLKFNCVLNFNFYNVHYTLANFVKNQHNVINVIADKKQKVY